MRHQCFVWCLASSMTVFIRLDMLVEFAGVLWGNLLQDQICDFLHACQVLFNLTSEAKIYPFLCNASIATNADQKGTSPNVESHCDKPSPSLLSFPKMTVSLQTFAISKRLEQETSAWSQIKDLFK